MTIAKLGAGSQDGFIDYIAEVYGFRSDLQLIAIHCNNLKKIIQQHLHALGRSLDTFHKFAL